MSRAYFWSLNVEDKPVIFLKLWCSRESQLKCRKRNFWFLGVNKESQKFVELPVVRKSQFSELLKIEQSQFNYLDFWIILETFVSKTSLLFQVCSNSKTLELRSRQILSFFLFKVFCIFILFCRRTLQAESFWDKVSIG